MIMSGTVIRNKPGVVEVELEDGTKAEARTIRWIPPKRVVFILRAPDGKLEVVRG